MDKAKDWKKEALKQAKVEAEKGEFISHEAMKAWIDSLGADNELPAPCIDIFKNKSLSSKDEKTA